MSASANPVIVYTDGACSGNPGPGGWAAVLMKGDRIREIAGGEDHTTNNRMEMLAVIQALEILTKPCAVRVHSDSAYIVNAFRQGWLANWKRNGWLTSTKKPVENRDLWERLDALTRLHEVEFVKVKGHSDDTWNNRCDELARAESAARQKTKG